MSSSRLPTLTETERSLLKALVTNGPTNDVPAVLRRRLSLYSLISETPRGWIITEQGMEAIARAKTH